MRINIRNNAQLSNKYIRFAKWKANKIKAKFAHLLYIEASINSEGQSPKKYSATIRLGVTGNDIIIQNKSEDLKELFQKSYQAMHRYLERNKPSNSKRRRRSMKMVG